MTKVLLAACCLFFLATNTAWSQEPFTEKVVCFGDSITMGYRAGAGNRFANVLQKRAPEAEFIAKGSGGRTTHSGKANLAKFLEDGSDATTFIIQLGVNDLKRKTELPPNTVKNMEEIIATIREKAPDARIIICGPPRIVQDQLDEGIVEREVFNEETNRILKEMGTSFKQLAQRENAQFVDLYDVVSSENYPDGLHPDAAGHQQIAEALWMALTEPAAQVQPGEDEVLMAEGYYKPLDGRYAFDTLFPLVNTYTLENNPNILQGTPFANADAGYTVIEAVVNGEPVDAFTDADVGKEFVLLWGHMNPPVVNYDRVDEYAPLEITSRYSKVVHRISGSRIVVDFAYNGGDRDEPVDLENWKARIFRDSSEDWREFGQALNREDTPDVGRLEEYRPHPAGHYRVYAYELKSFDTMPITRESQVKIHSGGNDKFALVKIGVEDHYRLESADGTNIYNRPAEIFNVNNGSNNFICHNIIFSPVHRQHNSGAVSGIRVLTSASSKPAGVMAIIGAKTYTEFDQIDDTENGAVGITNELPALASLTNGRTGIYEGEGLARKATQSVTQAFINCDFMGATAFGASTANGDGCNMVYIDCTGDFNPQSRWGKSVLDYTGYISTDPAAYEHAPELVRQAREDGWYPTDVVTPTSAVNMLIGLSMGGSNRYNITNIDRFIFLKNNPNNRNLDGYYNIAYNRSGTPFKGGESFKSSSYDILQHEIPRTGKNYVISRHYRLRTKTYDWRREHGGLGLSSGDMFSYITNYNNPMATVRVDNADGFNPGDKVTSGDISKRIVEIDGNELRVIDKTGNFSAGNAITNGEVTANITGYSARVEFGYPWQVLPYAIRMDAAWTTILQRLAHEIDPLQIPSKGRGVAIQAGDRFRILPFVLVTFDGAFEDVDKVRGTIQGAESGATADISSFLRTYDPARSQEDNQATPYYQVNLADARGEFQAGETIVLTDGARRINATIQRASSHDPAQVHTSKGLERVTYPECPAEFVWAEHSGDTDRRRMDLQAYYTFYNVCEEPLPEDVPLTMEIEIVTSNAEYLLDPATNAQIRQKYIGNGRVGGGYVYEWPAGNNLWQEGNEFGSGAMAGGGSIPGHFAYSQVHHYWYFLRTDFNHGFWRQNYRKPPTHTINYDGRDITVVPLQFYSRGHILINCLRPMTGQFSRGDEGGQNFDRRRILEDYLADEGIIDPVPEDERAKLMSFGGDVKENTGYKHSYVREETTENAPLPPEDLLELLEELGIDILPLDRESLNERIEIE